MKHLKIKITPKKLLKAGYRDITAGEVFNKYASQVFQKRVRDEHGTKYFINVYMYDVQCEFEIYSELCDLAISTKFYAISYQTLEEVEKIIDDYFFNAKLRYYEIDEEPSFPCVEEL